jgi:hypothetical protein
VTYWERWHFPNLIVRPNQHQFTSPRSRDSGPLRPISISCTYSKACGGSFCCPLAFLFPLGWSRVPPCLWGLLAQNGLQVSTDT